MYKLQLARGTDGNRRWITAAFVCSALALAQAGEAEAQAEPNVSWGSYENLFSARSPWNSRPVSPVFGEYVIPKSSYAPSVAEGAWSTGVFLAGENDPPVTVRGLPGTAGVWDPDAEVRREISVPRWPAGVIPASAADGHADIVDPVAGIVHSFYKLRQLEGNWVASQYAWTRLNGRGWGDPAHYFQGARAAAVPTSGGLIRKHEIDDGRSHYPHALTMSLTYNGLSANPTYIFPATSADKDAATTNTGAIPEGALVMLPPGFNLQTITTPALRKVAETLQIYGAYVTDRNTGTPFVIYVENGSGFSLHRNGWNTAAANDLERIRQGLRQVTGVGGWIDGNGESYTPETNFNLLSMRGPWRLQSGTTSGIYETWRQAVVFPPAPVPSSVVNTSYRGMQPVSWALPVAGQPYQLTARTTGGGLLRFQLRDKTSSVIVYDSNNLADGETARFVWPAGNVGPVVTATSGVGVESTVAGELRREGP